VSGLGYYVPEQQVDVQDVSTKSKPSLFWHRSAYAGTHMTSTMPASSAPRRAGVVTQGGCDALLLL
jgi:hypothetical protein